MSTMGAVAIWRPMAPVRPGGVPATPEAVGPVALRLTRRGRLLRTSVLAVLAVVMVAASVAQLSGEPVRAGSEPTVVVATAEVVVEQGDSLWSIARRVAPGSDPRDVVYGVRELNGLRSNLIQPGQVLLVPSDL